MEEAAGGPGPGSVTQLRVRCPGTEHRLAEEEDPDPGPRMQDHLSDQQQGSTQEKKWPGSVTQLLVRLAEEEEKSGIRMERDQTQARGCGIDGTICLTHCHRLAQSSHTREVVARLATSVGCA